MADPVITQRSVLLAAPAAEVWAVAATPAGVGDELMPLVRMTFPASVAGLTSEDITMGRTVCHCWLLAGGVVPFDRHALAFESISDDPDGYSFGFVEESTSWMQRRWRHERTVTPLSATTCRVTDRLTVVPRLAGARHVVRRLVPLVFEHRHRRLVARWGAA
ncbi:MAG TPA: hypothetical protein PLS46_21180 [Microthrixaceae bacterium]|jgi:hypothetical protein|nr:hypothetical protein [Microthrixaceae bacterium]